MTLRKERAVLSQPSFGKIVMHLFHPSAKDFMVDVSQDYKKI